MQSIFVKTLALTSSFLLMAGFVTYRGGYWSPFSSEKTPILKEEVSTSVMPIVNQTEMTTPPPDTIPPQKQTANPSKTANSNSPQKTNINAPVKNDTNNYLGSGMSEQDYIRMSTSKSGIIFKSKDITNNPPDSNKTTVSPQNDETNYLGTGMSKQEYIRMSSSKTARIFNPNDVSPSEIKRKLLELSAPENDETNYQGTGMSKQDFIRMSTSKSGIIFKPKDVKELTPDTNIQQQNNAYPPKK